MGSGLGEEGEGGSCIRIESNADVNVNGIHSICRLGSLSVFSFVNCDGKMNYIVDRPSNRASVDRFGRCEGRGDHQKCLLPVVPPCLRPSVILEAFSLVTHFTPPGEARGCLDLGLVSRSSGT